MSLATTNFAIGDSVQPLPISPVQINGAILRNARTQQLQMESQVGQHDQLRLTLLMSVLDASTLVDQPIYLRYGSNPNYGYFYGYTTNVSKPQTTTGADSQIVLTALGFSSAMKLSPSRMFRTRTTPQILADVLASYPIGLSTQDHPFVHQRIAQVARTDWEFIVEVAKLAGFYLSTNSGAVVMSHPIRALDYGAFARDLVKSSQTLDSNPLIDFVPGERINTTKDDFEAEFTYFTPTGIQKSVPDVPPEQRVKIPNYVYSQEYAEFLSAGMKVMSGMFQTAMARIRGDAGLRPGDTVNIRTGLTPAATDSFDGLWYVNEVETYIDSKVFQTGLGLCRDMTRLAKSGAYLSFYDTDPRNFPTMKLGNDGLWQSSWSN